MTDGKRVRVSVTLPIEIINEFRMIKEASGIPISKQIEFKLRGYSLKKNDRKK